MLAAKKMAGVALEEEGIDMSLSSARITRPFLTNKKAPFFLVYNKLGFEIATGN